MPQTKKKTFFEIISDIVYASRGTQLSSEFFKNNNALISKLAKPFNISPLQAVLFAKIVEEGIDGSASICELSDHFETPKLYLYDHCDDINYLVEMGLIYPCSGGFRSRNRGDSYAVPSQVIRALKRNEVYHEQIPSGLTCVELFGELHDIFTSRKNEEVTYDQMNARIKKLFEMNNHLSFVKYLQAKNFTESDLALYLFICDCYVEDDDDGVSPHDFSEIFDSRPQTKSHESRLSNGNHILMKEGLVEYSNYQGFNSRISFKLTEKSKDEVLAEIGTPKPRLPQNMIKPDTISAKSLYYNETEQRQVRELSDILSPDKFSQVQKRLSDSGLRCGFACLFYGAPGTGKTETVLQLARQTGREIMQVNFSQMKSCWVGESEKNVKKLFDRYRMAVKLCDKTPILLFNEADALFGKRMEGAERAVDKMENAIQNIILQEMETLNGIMIATTNLTQNLDPAFERRFLYKIRFEQPSEEARQNIWMAMMPSLSESDAKHLAGKYDFSGGQIENIVRKQKIQNVFSGQDCTLEQLCNYCNEERIAKASTRTLGFVHK